MHNAQSIATDEINDEQTVRFDVSWSNSWRIDGPGSIVYHDAAWIFMKYRVGESDWRHASLVRVGVQDTTLTTLTLAPDGLGAMLHRKQDGTGDVSHEGLFLTWDYGADGVADGAEVTMEIFGIEMVYVPKEDYYLGSDGGGVREFYQVGFLSRNSYKVKSEGAIDIGLGLGDLAFSLLPLDGILQDATIPITYPKGHAAFYCMKYEVSQRQYASFYNSASEAQRTALVLDGMDVRLPETDSTRNGLAILPDGTAMTIAPNVPVNWISSAQILAFLDWSGLRPMTELEFEKACRGTASAVADEYAWGAATVNTAAYSLIDAYLETEALTGITVADASLGNGVYHPVCPMNGPLRSGIFANSFPTREGSGGSFYGIMELSGNLSEYTVTATNATGRSYTGQHGNGTLTAAGTADVPNWPTATAGFGTRGGAFSLDAGAMRVSDRSYAISTFVPAKHIGFRGVRTAFP